MLLCKRAFCFFFVFLSFKSLSATDFKEPPLNLSSVDIEGENSAEVANFDHALRQKKTELPDRLIQERQTRNYGEVLPTLHGLEHPLTQSFVERYSKKSGLLWIESVLKNAAPYLSFIREEITLRQLPPELLYLPVIESGFSPTAKSSSGAAGLWQFMKNSIRPYMSITDYVDERLDFWISTNAALSKLEANYKQYGDWALSLAAYNSGAGAVSGIIKKTGINDYWILAEKKVLRTESIYYVPKLLAIYYIISNPRKFSLDISWQNKADNWVRIPVQQRIDINLLAEHAGIDKIEMRRANSELLFNITPSAPHFLKVKESQADAVRGVLARDDLPLIVHNIHIVKEGDTLWSIARAAGIKPETLAAENDMNMDAILKIGRRLKIP